MDNVTARVVIHFPWSSRRVYVFRKDGGLSYALSTSTRSRRYNGVPFGEAPMMTLRRSSVLLNSPVVLTLMLRPRAFSGLPLSGRFRAIRSFERPVGLSLYCARRSCEKFRNTFSSRTPDLSTFDTIGSVLRLRWMVSV